MSMMSVQRLVVKVGFGFAKFIASPKTAEQPKLTFSQFAAAQHFAESDTFCGGRLVEM